MDCMSISLAARLLTGGHPDFAKGLTVLSMGRNSKATHGNHCCRLPKAL